MDYSSYSNYLIRALKHYPDLKHIDVSIKVVRKALFPYACRPDILPLVTNNSNRSYSIYIATTANSGEENILFDQLPEDAKVGILGHEIAHIIYYENCSTLKLLKVALLYFFPVFRRKFERDTDKRCIRRGLGKELLEYSTYVHDFINRSGKLRWVKKYYLSPVEIAEEIERLNESG